MKIVYYVFIALVVLLEGCASSKSMLIDVKTPARIVFPSSVANVVIVDNSAQTKMDPEINPSTYNVQTYKKTYLQALNQFIKDEQFFSSVSLDTVPLRNDTNIDDLHILGSKKVIDILEDKNADAVITLDILNLENSPALLENDYGEVLNLQSIYLTAVMSIYGSDGQRLTNSFGATSDTIFRLANDASIIDRGAIGNMLVNLADNSTKILLPYWQKQERVIFNTGTKNDKQAQNKVNEARWTDAALLWGEDYKTEKSNSKKSKLAANIALCNEMLTDIDYALEWVNSAIALAQPINRSYTETLQWYKTRLIERKKDFPQLQKQLKGN